MKKWLSGLAAITIIATGATSTVACDNGTNKFDLATLDNTQVPLLTNLNLEPNDNNAIISTKVLKTVQTILPPFTIASLKDLVTFLYSDSHQKVFDSKRDVVENGNLFVRYESQANSQHTYNDMKANMYLLFVIHLTK